MQTKVIELRRLLAERFPPSRPGAGAVRPHQAATGVPALDDLLGGGLPRGEFTELIAEGHGTGSAQVLHAWLQQVAVDGQYLALIDGMDSFDATVEEPEVLSRLLWVRCRRADEALQAADVLLRDRNFPLIALDLKLNPPAQLRKIQSSVWHRFKRLLEQTQAAVLVMAPTPLVSGAACRVRMESGLGVEVLQTLPAPERWQFTLLRQGGMETGVARAG
jgi:transposase-like protein